MAKRFYVTTPIYYVNSTPHVGHALTMMACDVEKRYRELRGEEACFLTGTDENGLKVLEAAEQAGEEPQAFVDRISRSFKDDADLLRLDYDIFNRTTDPHHTVASQRLFEILRDNGHIFEDTYKGWYDVSAETFVLESEVVDGKSPDGNPVKWVEEKNWFFRLSSFAEPLLKKIEEEPDWLQPEGRKNEVVAFIKQGLRDICISRSNPGWGIPVPGDESRVIYVWFEAVINYLAATGWPEKEAPNDLWPADVHWMAKEIFTRFHATLWPAMLMGAGLPLPKCVIAHGWFTFKSEKMSKSKGNATKPLDLIERFEEDGCSRDMAIDAVRWALIRAFPYETDTNFTSDEVERIYNVDLANDLGNGLNRTLSMAHKFVGGSIPDAEPEGEALESIKEAKEAFAKAVEEHRLHDAAEAALGPIRYLNKYIDRREPWTLNKNGVPALNNVMRSAILLIRTSEGLIRPIMPAAAAAIARQLGLEPISHWDQIGDPATAAGGTALSQPEPMYPRLQEKKATVEEKPKEQPKPKKEKKQPEPAKEIEFGDFMNVSLKVARIIEAEPIEGSKKLTKLQVTIGEEKRQILAGIKQHYEPEDLIGRQIVVVANLKPAKLMGHESQGMLLAADDVDGAPILLQPDREAPDGTSVH